MRRRLRALSGIAGVAAGLAVALDPTSARAGELQLDAGAQVLASTWRADYGGGTTLRFGYRFARIVSIDAMTWEALASVDTRLCTGLTLGVTGAIPLDGVRPTLRAFALHQHEESLVSVAEAPAGVIFGIGQGIRHRAGGGGTLGLEIPFLEKGEIELVARPSATFAILGEDDIGPQAFFMLGGSVGLNYRVASLP